MLYDIEDPEDILFLQSSYKHIGEYVVSKPTLNLPLFNKDIKKQLTLFTIMPKVDFYFIDLILKKVQKIMPHLIEIFHKPLMHLKSEEVVVDIETVRRIDKATVIHLSKHSNIWGNIENGTIRPKKLLTKVNVDDYGIYENLVFCFLIDKILRFVNKYKGHFDEVTFNKDIINSDLFSKVNHLSYYLAIAKLHISYLNVDDNTEELVGNYINKLNALSEILNKNKNNKVYRLNKKHLKKLTALRKTNILSMHKDYKHVYNLLKYFSKIKKEKSQYINEEMLVQVKKNYYNYCKFLLIFAIIHFNFGLKDKVADINNENFDLMFKNSKWSLELKNIKLSFFDELAILLTVKNIENQKKYDLLIYQNISSSKKLSNVIQEVRKIYKADEYAIVHPYDFETKNYYGSEQYENISKYDYSFLLISINNIDSFRRFQKIILKAMILVDDTYDICPFCTSTMIDVENKSGHKFKLCKKCKQEIIFTTCNNCGKEFVYTDVDIDKIKNRHIELKDYNENKWLYLKVKEGLMHFRNITEFSDKNMPICPRCNKEVEVTINE